MFSKQDNANCLSLFLRAQQLLMLELLVDGVIFLPRELTSPPSAASPIYASAKSPATSSSLTSITLAEFLPRLAIAMTKMGATMRNRSSNKLSMKFEHLAELQRTGKWLELRLRLELRDSDRSFSRSAVGDEAAAASAGIAAATAKAKKGSRGKIRARGRTSAVAVAADKSVLAMPPLTWEVSSLPPMLTTSVVGSGALQCLLGSVWKNVWNASCPE